MPKGRHRLNINGILLLDKPQGLSSNQALQQVKRLYQAAKAGHTGALDPLATGMLPICFGEATKFSQFLLDSHKAYRVVAQLGVRTDSSDATGKITQTREVKVSRRKLSKALENFRGESDQLPSMFSALKHQGQPLYKFARQGVEIERKTRKIFLSKLELIHFADDFFELEIECSKGTYIRTLIDDLGEQLGCGAHVTQLRRLFVAEYSPEKMLTLQQLQTDEQQNQNLLRHLLPIDSALLKLQKAILDPPSQIYFSHGQAISYAGLDNLQPVRVYDDAQNFLGIGKIDDNGLLAPKRLVNQQN